MLELASGTSLGAYVITARIGRGGMASVYQAHHPALDRNVAIKVLWESLADQPGFLERFRREARAASRLRHPNILTVYDFGEDGGIAYMVTELLPGGTLADRLGVPLAHTEVLRVLRGIGSALDAAHVAGLIHRDVKPSNILFTRDGEPVLADFGIARLMESEEQLTVQGTLIGTPHYMAPEMASGEEVGKSSDLYSLGVVLYEMLAGEPPFPRPTPIAVVRAHIHEPPPPLSLRNPPVPDSVDAVVSRALAKQPAQRYRSGAALAAAFEDAILAGDPPTPRPGSVPVWGAQHYADTARQAPPPESNTADMPPWQDPSQTGGIEAPTRERPAYSSFDAYDAVIPGPPGVYNAPPGAYTDRWPQAMPVAATAVRAGPGSRDHRGHRAVGDGRCLLRALIGPGLHPGTDRCCRHRDAARGRRRDGHAGAGHRSGKGHDARPGHTVGRYHIEPGTRGRRVAGHIARWLAPRPSRRPRRPPWRHRPRPHRPQRRHSPQPPRPTRVADRWLCSSSRPPMARWCRPVRRSPAGGRASRDRTSTSGC